MNDVQQRGAAGDLAFAHPRLTPEALIAMPEMLAASVSPDGRWVAWTSIGRDPVGTVYVAPTDGSSPPRRVAAGAYEATVESWSADSRNLLLAMTDDGDEKVRLCIAPVEAPGDLRLLTDPTPAYYITGGALHPDGRWLVYAANCDETGQPIESTCILRQDIETGERRVLARTSRAVHWRPQLNHPGTHVAYGRSDRHPAGRTLWLVDIDGELDREILAFADTDKLFGAWSPDGTQLVVLHEMRAHARVGLWNLVDGSLRWLLDDPRRSIESAFWPPGSKDILIGESRQAMPCSSLLDPATGDERSFTEQIRPLAPIGADRWAGRYTDARYPVEIVDFDAARPAQRRSLSQVWRDAPLDPADLTAAESFRWRSVDGLSIQGWLYRARGPVRGTVLSVHGGPTYHSEDEYNPLIQCLVAAGFNVLDPNYRGSTGFGLAFQESIKEQGWGGLEQDDIRTGAEALIVAGIAKPGRIGITGLSYGGYSSWWAITHCPPELIAAAAPICGMTDLVVDYESTRPDLRYYSEEMLGGSPAAVPDRYRERSPINFVDRIRGRLLIIQGMRDPNVTPENMRVVCRALDAAGKRYELLAFDDEGHGVFKPKNRAILYRRLIAFFTEAYAAR